MKKFLNQRFLVCIVFISLGSTLVGCGKDDQQSQSNNANVTTPAGQAAGSASGRPPRLGGRAATTVCENTVTLEAPHLKLVTQRGQIPKVHMKLKTLRFQMVYPETGEAYRVAAHAEDKFEGQVECNSLTTLEDENYQREWQDADGVLHRESSKSNLKLRGTISSAEWIDTQLGKSSGTKRVFEALFENGQLTSLKARSEPLSQISSTPASRDPQMERIQVGDDVYATYRIYLLREAGIDVRIKLEYPADENGVRDIQYSQIIYKKR